MATFIKSGTLTDYFNHKIEKCSYNIHLENIYDDQTIAKVEWEVQGVTYTGSVVVINTGGAGDFTVTQRLYTVDANSYNLIETNSKDLTVPEYKVNPSLSVTHDANCVDCCIPTGSTIEVYPKFDIPTYEDGGTQYFCSSYDINITVKDYFGEEIVNSNFTMTLPNFVNNGSDFEGNFEISFTPDKAVKHTVTVTIDGCCGSCEYTRDIDICNSWEIVTDECNIHKVTNYGADDLTITVEKLQDVNGNREFATVSGYDSKSISPDSTEEISVATGVYKYTIKEKDYYIVELCEVDKCDRQLLLDFLCGKGDNCDKLELMKRLNRRIEFRTLRDVLESQIYELKTYQNTVEVPEVFGHYQSEIMDRLLYIDDIIIELKSVCNNCGIRFKDCPERDVKLNKNKDDCGCPD